VQELQIRGEAERKADAWKLEQELGVVRATVEQAKAEAERAKAEAGAAKTKAAALEGAHSEARAAAAAAAAAAVLAHHQQQQHHQNLPCWSFPETWSDQQDDGADRTQEWWQRKSYVCVEKGSEEWEEATAHLQESLPTAKVLRVQRVEHRMHWRAYQEAKQRILDKRGVGPYTTTMQARVEIPADAVTGQRFPVEGPDGRPWFCTVPAGGAIARGRGATDVVISAEVECERRWLWHGTGKTSPLEILDSEGGLDFRFSSAGGLYGQGTYLAERAAYSDHSYAHSVCDLLQLRPPLFRQLLLTRAAIGCPKQYGRQIDRDLRVPPVDRSLPSGGRFDSVHAGPHFPRGACDSDSDKRAASMMYVLYGNYAAYADYIVTYASVGKPTQR
jgi:hypothetical protein